MITEPLGYIYKNVYTELQPGELPLAEGIAVSTNERETYRNNNILVVGSTGSQKTRCTSEILLLSDDSSFVVVDVKGRLYKRYGQYLDNKGYDVKLLDLTCTDVENSVGYNPLSYIQSEQDINVVAEMIAKGNKPSQKNYDSYWEEADKQILSALIGLLYERKQKGLVEPAKYNLSEIYLLMSLMQTRREGSSIEAKKLTELDKLFLAHMSEFGPSMAVKNYIGITRAHERTMSSIQVTSLTSLNQFNFDAVKKLTSNTKSFDFRKLGMEKTALFVQISDVSDDMRNIETLFFNQCFHELIRYADQECEEGRLKVPVKLLLDDFGNYKIKGFERLINTIRSRNISATCILQTFSQLQQIYGDQDAVTGGFDSIIFTGTADVALAKKIAEMANVPVEEVLELQLDESWIFRRCEKAIKCKKIDVDKMREVKMNGKEGLNEGFM